MLTDKQKAEVLKLAEAQIAAQAAYRQAREAFFQAEAALGPNYVLAHGLDGERRALAPYHAAYLALAPAMHAADKAMFDFIWDATEPESIGATLIGLAREGLPHTEARRRLLACGMSETGADALIQSATKNLTVKA